MNPPEGRVLSVEADTRPVHALVEVVSTFRCARCASGKGCGAGLLPGDTGPRRVEALVPGNVDLQAGDRVQLQLTADNVLRAAALVYGLPLAGALGAAGLAWVAHAGDVGAALAALAGAATGAVAGHLRLRRVECLQQFTPTVSARLGSG